MKHIKLFEQFVKPQTLNEGKVNTSKIIKRIEKSWELADNIDEITEEDLDSRITVNFKSRMPSLERVKITIKISPRVAGSASDRMRRESQLREIVELEGGIPVMAVEERRGDTSNWIVQFITPEGFGNSELLKDKNKLELVANMIIDRFDESQRKRLKTARVARWLKKDAKTNPDYNHMENLAEAAALYLSHING